MSDEAVKRAVLLVPTDAALGPVDRPARPRDAAPCPLPTARADRRGCAAVSSDPDDEKLAAMIYFVGITPRHGDSAPSHFERTG